MFIFVVICLCFFASILATSFVEFEYDKAKNRAMSRKDCNHTALQILENVKHFIFVIRWFIIGKYHCNVPRNLKRFYWVINRLLWFFIFFCMWYFFLSIFNEPIAL